MPIWNVWRKKPIHQELRGLIIAIGNNPMSISSDIIQRIDHAVDQDRLLETAVALMEVPSPTCDAAGVSKIDVSIRGALHGASYVDSVSCAEFNEGVTVARQS